MIRGAITHTFKVIGLTLLIFFALLVLLNFGYFWQNLRYDFGYKTELPPVKISVTGQPDWLTIPTLGIAAPIVYAGQPDEKSFQAALLNGVAHYAGTADPGQLGNCYIFGHSSDYIWSKGHYKNVFALLPKIKIGAEISVSDSRGKQFVYIVVASHEVASSDLSVLSQQNYQKKLLTLQTSYPVGTALARWVVVGEVK